MFKRKQIDQRVQKALFRKIDAMNRLGLTNDRTYGEINKNQPFFIGDSLEPQDNSNPIEQHLYRGCFAKVSVAVKDQEKSTESTEVGQPISISSYIGKENDILSHKNKPLAFRQGFEESSDNRFLGESGITSINVNQMEYYTNNFNIGWVCPDPVFFEEKFEPSFLKLGAFVAIEFGWGIDDGKFQVESLSIEEMKRLLKGTNLIERNLNTAGNYYCGVGTVTKFDWKITDNGTYAGDIQVMSPGASALLETTQGTGAYSDVVSKIKSTFKLQKVTERLNESKVDNPEQRKDQQEINKKSNSATEVVESLKDNSILFNMVIKNLKDVMDKKLENVVEIGGEGGLVNETSVVPISPYGAAAAGINKNSSFIPEFDGTVKGDILYKYQDGLLNIKSKGEGPGVSPDYFKNRYFCNWGWFEDNILQDFFNLSTKDGVELQKVESKLNGEPNKCQSSEYLYSLGLDHVILPNQHQPLLNAGFNAIKDKSLIEKYYKRNQRRNLVRMHAFYSIIDRTFGKEAPFRGGVSETDLTLKQETINIGGVEVPVAGDISSDGTFTGPFYSGTLENYGTIRNMVFPMQMFITHFQGISSLRQGLRNFWADVTNQYGGYWGFQIGESKEEPNTVGVFDSYYAPEGLNTINSSDKLNTNETFEFSILSKNSIVKDFDVSLDLSAEASVQARYGGLNSVKDGNQKQDGKKDLGLEAWNILTANTTLEENLNKEDFDQYKAIDNAITSIRYKRENDDFYTKIKSIQNDEDAYREQVENETTNFVEGVGCYTKRGNFSKYFKSIMLYLINYSTAKGSGSNLEQGQIQIPISLTMTLDGIGGLQVGNIFTIDYLPKLYRDSVYFMITKVNHKVSTTGWETDLESIMTARMKDVWNKSNKQLEDGIEDYLELFKITNVTDYDDKFDNLIENNLNTVEELRLESIKTTGQKVAENIESNEGVKTLIEGESDDGTIDIYSGMLDF